MGNATSTAGSIIDILKTAQHQLCTAESVTMDNARFEAEILLGNTLKHNRTYLRTWPEREISREQSEQFMALVNRRCEGEPIAYIIGERDFWDMTLRVSPDTLIPRPETEIVVEQALTKIPLDAHWQIADLGTGSGAIALAIARERPKCQLIATDISAAALSIARDNAARHNLHNIRFAEGAWLTPLAGETFEMIISNPPYVHPDDPHLQQGDLRFEPLTALHSTPDGLTDIRTICDTARQHLNTGGWLLLEHGFDQGPAVRDCLTERAFQHVNTIEDLAHNPRVSLGRWDNSAP